MDRHSYSNPQAPSFSNRISRRALLASSCAIGIASNQLTMPAMAATSKIKGWRFCVNCFALFQQNVNGVCPGNANLPHNGQGFEFTAFTGDEDTCSGDTERLQSFWKECDDCGVMYFSKSIKPKICPATNKRHIESGDFCYSLPINRQNSPALNREGPRAQGGWRYCGKCTVMFFDGDLNNKGVCPAGGSHAALGDSFVLSHL